MIIRQYPFSDAILIHFVSIKLNFAARDEAQFLIYGFTVADRLALEAENEIVLNFPDDIEYKADYMEAIEKKNKARKILEIATRQLLQKVSNRYGRKSVRYKTYRTKGMTEVTDLKLESIGKRVERSLQRDLNELSTEGVTQVAIDAYKILLRNFIKAEEIAYDKKWDRTIAAENRVKMGNALFAKYTQLCNTGKDIWKDESEARYNDYLTKAK